MESHQLMEFGELLRERRRELERQVISADRELAELSSARADSTADDEHDPEGSTLSGDWSRISGLRSATRAQIAAVERGIERVDRGKYGRCVICGRDIPIDRLRARPAAENCVSCAA